MTNRYKWLATYYDALFKEPHAWCDVPRAAILVPLLAGVESACDLACGTGTRAVALARRGIRVVGVDLSADMCRVARQKAGRTRLPIQIRRGDMRDFSLREPVDLVTCEWDALNHVPAKSDLVAVAQSVSRALRPAGYFYFDVNMKLSFEKLWPSTWFVELPGAAVAMRGGYDRSREVAWTRIAWFVGEGHCWRRHNERIEEVCWTGREIRSALRVAGFTRVRSWDASEFIEEGPLSQPGLRTFYLAQKRKR